VGQGTAQSSGGATPAPTDGGGAPTETGSRTVEPAHSAAESGTGVDTETESAVETGLPSDTSVGDDTADIDTGLGVTSVPRWVGGVEVEHNFHARIYGEEEWALVGMVGDIGDVTGDGLPDLFVSGEQDTSFGGFWIFTGPVAGGTNPVSSAPITLTDGNTAWVTGGGSAGDRNGDGIGDLFTTGGYTACLYLGPMEGWSGILGDHQTSCFFIEFTPGLGRNQSMMVADRDVTGDGVIDTLIGGETNDDLADFVAPDNKGTVWVFPGPLKEELWLDQTEASTECTGVDDGDHDQIHAALSRVANPELNGDGLADIVLGAIFGSGPQYPEPAGEVLVAISPPAEGVFDPDGYDGVWTGIEETEVGFGDLFGANLTRGGDLTGDGLEEIVAGAPFEDGEQGRPT
jgi:hypothetical protein